MAPRISRKGIFCLETDWWGVQHRTTVEPVLQLLNTYDDLRIPYIHRDVGTREEFDHYLKKWTQKGLSRYPILYLGFHGEPGVLCVGERRGDAGRVTLVELGELLEGECKGRVIHLGSCSTLDHHGRLINTFLQRTGAVAILGYRATIDWVESAAFEVILLGALQEVSLTKQGMTKLQKQLRQRVSGLSVKGRQM